MEKIDPADTPDEELAQMELIIEKINELVEKINELEHYLGIGGRHEQPSARL